MKRACACRCSCWAASWASRSRGSSSRTSRSPPHRSTSCVPSTKSAAAKRVKARRPSQDRHGDGAHRHSLVHRREAARSVAADEARRRGRHLHSLRERRRAGSHALAAAARTLPRSAALLREALAAHAATPCGELGRHPATAGELFRHRAAGHPVLRLEPRSRAAADVAGEAGAALGHQGRVLQGGEGRQLR